MRAKKMLSGLAVATLLMMAMGLTDCPECGHVVCKCGNMDAVYAAEAQEDPDHIILKDDGEPMRELTVEEQIAERCADEGLVEHIPLITSIAKHETGHFTSDAFVEGNNVGGMSVAEQPIEYASLEEGIDEFVSLLKDFYIEEGLVTVEAIAEKYCPVDAENWIRSVSSLMEVENVRD